MKGNHAMSNSYTNVSNPTAFGVEWTHPDSGNRHTLFTIRGTTSLHYGLKANDRDVWSTMPVVNPERFGLTEPVKSFKAFMTIVRAYVEA